MDNVGGYRLVRRLGSGARAEVHLGHSSSDLDSPSHTAAIKIYRPSTSRASIDEEIEALARCSSPFLLRLDDLATARDGLPILILNRVGSKSLSALCLERDGIANGEAVTIIAPLADAVDQVHRVGVAHGNIRLGTVHFDDTGAPVLIGFGSARIVGASPGADDAQSLSPAELEASMAVITDLDDLRSLARTVIECTPRSTNRTVLCDWLSDGEVDPTRFCGELRERMFDFATAAPVELHSAPRSGAVAASPERLRGTGREDVGDAVPMPQWMSVLHLPAWAEDLVPRGRFEPVAIIRAALTSVRRPVWIAAGVVAALLVVATVFVGQEDQSAADAAPGSADSRPASDVSAEVFPSAESSATDRASTDRAGELATATTGDDPVAAVSALVSRRSACFEQGSALCLDEVDQVSSAAMEADVYAMSMLRDAPADSAAVEPDLTIGTPVLVERLGGSAIVTLDFPDAPTAQPPLTVSVLVVKGESGWRIRDLVTG